MMKYFIKTKLNNKLNKQIKEFIEFTKKLNINA